MLAWGSWTAWVVDIPKLLRCAKRITFLHLVICCNVLITFLLTMSFNIYKLENWLKLERSSFFVCQCMW